MKIKILLLSANPRNTNNLRLAEEFRSIKDSISRSKYRDAVEVIQGEAVRQKDLRRLLLDKAPHIVHFSGHAEKEGVFLEDEQGNSEITSGEKLEELFSLFDSICCVILNACYSKSQALHLVNVVPYVIGMNRSIEDKNAISFSVGFYDAIAANRSIEEAFKFGVNSIKSNENSTEKRSLDTTENYNLNNIIPVLLKGKITRVLPSAKGSAVSTIKHLLLNKRTLIVMILVSLGLVVTLNFSTIWSTVPPENEGKNYNEKCLNNYLSAISNKIIKSIEVGSSDLRFTYDHQVNNKQTVLIFRENSKLIATLIMNLYPENEQFKVISIVDKNCNKIETFFNNTHKDGRKYLLQNWETLNINIDKKTYLLTLGHIEGKIEVNNFTKVE